MTKYHEGAKVKCMKSYEDITLPYANGGKVE